MPIASLREHTDAFLALITSVPVGDGERPAGGGWAATPGQTDFVGYCVVHPISSSFSGGDRGTLANPDEDAELVWQATCVGATREQCENVIDLVCGDVIGVDLEPSGRRASNRVRLQSTSGGARREEDNTQPPLWVAAVRFVVDSTPA